MVWSPVRPSVLGVQSPSQPGSWGGRESTTTDLLAPISSSPHLSTRPKAYSDLGTLFHDGERGAHGNEAKENQRMDNCLQQSAKATNPFCFSLENPSPPSPGCTGQIQPRQAKGIVWSGRKSTCQPWWGWGVPGQCRPPSLPASSSSGEP